MDPNEKQLLLEQIALLEKEMISKQSIETEAAQMKRDENNEFRQYGLQQLQNGDEMERKIAIIQEEKRKEEEALQNDVSK